MQKSYLNAINTLNNNDIESMMYDSQANQDQLTEAKKLLVDNGLCDLFILRFYGKNTISYMSTSHLNLVLPYTNASLWTQDQLFDFDKPFFFKTNSLYQFSSDKIATDRSGSPSWVYIFMDWHFMDKKDRFVFSFSHEQFQQLNRWERFLLYQRLRYLIKHLYRNVFFHQALVLPEQYIQKTDYNYVELTENFKQIQQTFKLSNNEMLYFSYLTTGCTAKQMAKHMQKSFRTVQSQIHHLCQKLKLKSKQDLENISNILMLQMVYKQPVFTIQ